MNGLDFNLKLSLTATVWLIAAILGVTAIGAAYLLYTDFERQRALIQEIRSIDVLRSEIVDLTADLLVIDDVVASGPDADAQLDAIRADVRALAASWAESDRDPTQIEPLVLLAERRIDQAVASSDDKSPFIAFQAEALRITSYLSGLVDPAQARQRQQSARWRTIAGALVIFMAVALGLAILALRRALRSHRVMLEQAKVQGERMAAMFNGSSDGMLSLDMNGRILDLNRSARTMLGGGTDAFRARALGEIVSLDGLGQGSFRDLAALLRAREEPVFETEATRKDGVTFRAGLTLGVYYLNNERHYIATIRDITRRKLLEEAKNAFVSTVSHELRTPLTSIAGSLDLLKLQTRQEDSSEKTRRLLDIAQTNVRRLIDLINDILDIEKLESGRAAMEVADVSLRELATRAVEANEALGHQRGVVLELENGPDVVVHGDQDRLMQVATNFISNAVKFSPEGGRVLLSVRRSAENGELAVRDFGPGVPADFQPHLFEKFSQADDARSRGKGSTGLGLAITREIAEQHGGQVRYEDAEGGGARFVVSLPASRLAQIATDDRQKRPVILHFDPDRDTLRVLADAFGTHASLISISSLADLQNSVGEFRPSLVIYDPIAQPKLLRSELTRIQERFGPCSMIAFTSLDREAMPDVPYDRHFVKSRTPVAGIVQAANEIMEQELTGA